MELLVSGLSRWDCTNTEPHLGHSWGVYGGSGFLCHGVMASTYYREKNRAELVGRTATYNGRRVTIVDADDSGCVQIALWVNRDQLEVDET
jgi:hypothetical protein